MLSTLELKNFRGLEHVRFENLGRANLIVGGNNTGKTSILEAIIMLHGDGEHVNALPRTFRNLPKQQRDPASGFWRLLARTSNPSHFKVSDGNVSAILQIDGQRWDFKRERASPNTPAIVSINSGGGVSAYGNSKYLPLSVLSTKQDDPTQISELFNQIAPLNPENEIKLEELLRRSIEPRLRRLRYARPQGTEHHLVYVDLGEGTMLPFTQLGQAFSRALQVYCEIFATQPKILLVDEIENGLYYEGLEDYWRGLLEVLEDQDVQLFATTHSRECMEAAHRAAKARNDYPLRYLRLDRRVDNPSKIVATTFAEEEMQTAIDAHLEMR